MTASLSGISTLRPSPLHLAHVGREHVVHSERQPAKQGTAQGSSPPAASEAGGRRFQSA